MSEFAEGARAAVRTAIAPMHAEPRISSAQVSQRLAGHVVDVVSADGEWVRVRGDDAYEGWVHRGYLTPVPRTEARGSAQVPRISLGCVTRTPSGGRRALPLGARLAPEETVKSGDAVAVTARADRFPRDPLAITRSAQEYFEGTGYQWGGVTPWGADCSGFVQAIFALHDVPLPRDAWQQALVGQAGEDDPLAAAPADLLFFTDRDDRRITHVGIALGGRSMVHLALGRGGYAVERLDDARDPYVAALRDRFVEARRVLQRA